MTATAAIVLTILLLEDPLTNYRLTRTQRADLQGAVLAAEAELDGAADPDSVAEDIGGRFGVWVLVARNGEVVGSTRRDRAAFDVARRYLLEENGTDGDRFTRTTLGEDDQEFFVYARVLPGGVVVQAMRSTHSADAMRSSVRELMLVAGALALIIGVALTWALSRTIVAPARQLTEVADSLARGDLSVRTFSQRDDELSTSCRPTRPRRRCRARASWECA